MSWAYSFRHTRTHSASSKKGASPAPQRTVRPHAFTLSTSRPLLLPQRAVTFFASSGRMETVK